MRKKFLEKLFSFISVFGLLLNSFQPFLFLMTPISSRAADSLEVKIDYNNTNNKFKIEINNKDAEVSGKLNYLLAYQTDKQTEAVIGKGIELNKNENFSKEIYAGTCSEKGEVCVPHNVLRGILKTEIKDASWFKSQWFEIDNGSLKVVNDKDISQLDLGQDESDWLEKGVKEALTEEKICLKDDENIVDATVFDWEVNNLTKTGETKDKVRLGIRYIFPLENKVTVTFKCLPKNENLRTPLKISQIKVSELNLPSDINPYGEYAYDITTEMTDGTFEYDITLPKPEDKEVKILYMEDKESEVKEIDEEKVNQEGDKVKAEGINHFTIYFVSDGVDLTNLLDPEILNASEKNSLKQSDDIRYETNGYWPIYWYFPYQQNQYLEFRFNPNIPNNAIINSVKIYFEYQRDALALRTSERDARIRAWDGAGFNVEIADYNDLKLSSPSSDETKIIDVPLSLVNTPEKVNNFKFRFYMRGLGPWYNPWLKTRHDYVALDVDYTLVSDVTICKQDSNGDPLSNWRVYLLGDKVGNTITVPSDSSVVNAGSYSNDNYVLLASGTYNYGDARMIADAANSYRYVGLPCAGATDGWVNGEASACMKNYLSLNFSTSGGPTAPGWGIYYNPEHKYAKSFSGGDLNLKIWDTCNWSQPEDCYGDNEGSLNLDIYKGYVGDTEDDGCVTFENVPYGSYELNEILQNGWERVSGTGNVDINEANETFTIVNKTNKTIKITGKKFNDVNYNGVDDQEQGLGNWTIYAAKKVDEVDVSAKDMPTVSSHISLDSRKKYLLRVSGTYGAGDSITADAKYSVRSPNTYWTDVVQNYESWGSTLLDLQINEVSPNWGSYNSNHIYWLTYNGTGSAINFRLYDFYPSNDTGSLKVQIYEVITETLTDSNGNYNLILPGDITGDIIVAEQTQDGWTQTAPTGDNFGYCSVNLNSENNTCNFGNALARGWIVVEKQTNPDNSNQEFNFTGVVSGAIKDNQKIISNELAPGRYMVTESDTNGWALTNISCNDSQSENPSTGNIDTKTATFGLDSDEVVKCIFTNTQSASIKVHKFEDANGDGDMDNNETGLSDWQMHLFGGKDCADDEPMAIGSTSSEGNLEFKNLSPGQYSVKEILQSGWKVTTPVCQNVTVSAGQTASVNFGNYKLGYIQGRKYNDTNQDGTRDEGENWLSGWTINLYDENWNYLNTTTTSGNNGIYRFENLDKGTYYTCEVLKQGWLQTGPVLGNNRVTNQSPNKNIEGSICWKSTFDQSNQSRTGRQFGNIQTGSISGYKWEDVDGDGKWDDGEEGKDGWLIEIKQNNQVVEQISTNEDGSYSIENLLPGDYQVCEESRSGWVKTYPNDTDCYDVALNPGEKVNDINFGNFELGKVTVTKFHDRNQDGSKDDGEEVLSGWDINLASDSGKVTESTNNNGQVVFDELFAGSYSLSETVLSDWTQTNIYCDNYNGDYKDGIYSLTITSGTDLNCYIGNYHEPMGMAAKSNNIYPSPITPGSTVTFTLKLKVENNNLYNVIIKDILPPGFKFNDVWSATVNGTEVSIPHPHFASPGTWQLGDLKEGDEVIITYQAKANSDIEPGLYKDLAWAVGNKQDDESSEKVLALAVDSGTDDPGVVGEHFVGTKIAVNKDTQNYTSIDVKKEETKEEQGEVLGASTGLPATGGRIVWLIIASVFSLFGLLLITIGLKMKKLNKIFNRFLGLLLVLGVYSLLSTNVFAGSLSVRISEPKSPTRFNTFDLNFVALDYENNPITVKCYFKKEGGVYSQFDTTKTLTAGGNAGSCKVTSSQLNQDGKTYSFYVEANNGTEIALSEIVSVDFNTQGPGTPTNYSKEKTSTCQYKIRFKTADDGGKTVKLEIYRSKETSFGLDAGTRIATIPLGSNTDYTYTDNIASECEKDWYYAIRAFDNYGNGSGWIGDTIVTIKTVSTSTTSTTTGETVQPTSGAIPVANVTLPAEEEIKPTEAATTEETGKEEVLGEQSAKKEEKKELKSIGEVLGEAVKKEENKKWIYIGGGAIVVIAIIGHGIYKVKSQKSRQN